MVMKDIRASPYALKRKHLVELLTIKDKVKDEDTNNIIEKTFYNNKKHIKIISRIKI